MTPMVQRHSAGVAARWAAIFRRRWPVGIAIFVVVGGLAAALVLLSRPVWRAETSLRLGAPVPASGVSLGGGSQSGLVTLFQQVTGDPFANELELLSSRTVVEGVVLDNALTAAVNLPRGWTRDSVLSRITTGRETRDATFEISWLDRTRVRVRRTAPTDSLVGEFSAGTPAVFGDIAVVFRPRRDRGGDVFEVHTIPFGEAVRRTTGRLNAERERRDANLVVVSYEDPDPGLALDVVTSAARRYMALRSDLQQRESGETTDSLRTIADRALEDLRRREDEMGTFQRTAGLVAPEAQGEAFVDRRADATASLESARNELARVDAVIARLDSASDPSTAWVGLIAHPTFLDNPTLGDLLERLLDLREQRIELAERRTAASPQAQSLDEQIAYLDGSLRRLVHQYRDGVAHEVDLLEADEARLDSMLRAMPGKSIELARRQRTVAQLSQLYLFTDQRLKQEALRNAVSFSSVQTVDPPEILFKPVWPRKKLGLGVGLVLALTFGALGMATLEKADRSVRSSSDVREMTGLPVLAVLVSGGGHRIGISALERRALLQRGRGDSSRFLLLAPVDDAAAAEEVAFELEAVPALDAPGGAMADGAPATIARRPVQVGPAIANYAAASELAIATEVGAEVVLVLRYGATRADDLVRAAILLREAGVEAVGAVVIAADAGSARRVWR